MKRLLTNHTRKTPLNAGFTIIELIVAVAVTTLMVGLMFSIVVNVLKGWDKSSGSLSSGNQARSVLDQLARDIQSSIMRRDGNAWLVATIQDSQTGTGDSGFVGAAWGLPASGTHKPKGTASTDPFDLNSSFVVPPVSGGSQPALDDYRFGQAGVWLRFISTCSDTNDGNLHRISAPRAVAYQIIRAPVVKTATPDPATTEYRYQLFRSEVRPGHSNPTLALRSTFRVGYDLFAPAYNDGSTYSGVYINGSVDEGGEPGSIRRPDYSQVIATNVIDFGVRFWGRNSDTNGDGVIDSRDQLVVLFPTSTGNTGFAATTNTSAVFTPPVVGPTFGFPEVAEVFVRILTDAGVTKIDSMEKGLLPGSWWETALANSQVYIRRIDFKTSL